MPAGLNIVDLAIGLSLVVTGALYYAHFKKHASRPIWRITAILVMLWGFFLAFGDFFYQLGRNSR